ncbi:transglutaminase domain-containing protein [Flavobacteriaceae bacterium 3-367]
MDYLSQTFYFDYESDEVQELVKEFKNDILSPKEKAKLLYVKVRDSYRYDPYFLSFSKEHFKASNLAKRKKGHCIDKSSILIACLRSLGIPARIHLAKVKNHIGVERLTEKFGTNELTPHGMVDLLLNGKWLKVSPAFNQSLCKMCNVEPLNFDGENDSILQEYNNDGMEFMEYLEDYGYFEDVPLEFMEANAREHYPHIFGKDESNKEFRL